MSATLEKNKKRPTEFSHKIITLDALAAVIARLKRQHKVVVHSHGVFDLLHPGHVNHFLAARKLGDVLVVTLTKDEYVNKGPGRPVFNHRLRAESIAAMECVDYVAVNEWPTAVQTIRKLKPSIYVKGADYINRKDDVTGAIHDEEEAIRSVGGKIQFTDEITFSSSQLLNSYFSVYPDQTQAFLKDFRARHEADDILKQLAALKKLKVLVIGDAIVDEYHYCQAMGKSPKETIVVTRYLREEAFAGGSLACANHAANFCGQVDLVALLGKKNSREDFIRSKLKSNVKPKFFYQENASTIIKRRFVDPAFLSKMFEICFLDHGGISKELESPLCDYLAKTLPAYDAVIVTDYGHGFIGPAMINMLCEKAKFLAVNAQTNSANIGYNLITKYPRADYICIDEPEIRLAMHDRTGKLENLIHRVSEQMNCKKVIITRGHLGSIAYSGGKFFETPVFSTEIVDRVGAGDAFLSVTAPCVAKGIPMDVVGFIGNAVGAMAVTIVCNRSYIEAVPLSKFVKTLLK